MEPISGIINGVGGLAKTVAASIASITDIAKVKKEDQAERDRLAIVNTMQTQRDRVADYSHADKNWYDSFISGLNRLPRPSMVALTISYFVYSFVSPEKFGVMNSGLATVPEPMWYVLLAIIGFYFGSRHLEKRLLTNAKQNFAKAAHKVAEKFPITPAAARKSEKELEDDFDEEDDEETDNSKNIRAKLRRRLRQRLPQRLGAK